MRIVFFFIYNYTKIYGNKLSNLFVHIKIYTLLITRPAKKLRILEGQHVVKITAYFCCCCIWWTLKKPLQACLWYRLLVLMSCLLSRKSGVCPEKVGKIAYFGCSEIKKSKFTCILLLELNRYWSKGDCIVIAILFINKYIGKLYRISFFFLF